MGDGCGSYAPEELKSAAPSKRENHVSPLVKWKWTKFWFIHAVCVGKFIDNLFFLFIPLIANLFFFLVTGERFSATRTHQAKSAALNLYRIMVHCIYPTNPISWMVISLNAFPTFLQVFPMNSFFLIPLALLQYSKCPFVWTIICQLNTHDFWWIYSSDIAAALNWAERVNYPNYINIVSRSLNYFLHLFINSIRIIICCKQFCFISDGILAVKVFLK